MKLDSWRDPYIKDTKFAGELVSSQQIPKKPNKVPVLKCGTTGKLCYPVRTTPEGVGA